MINQSQETLKSIDQIQRQLIKEYDEINSDFNKITIEYNKTATKLNSKSSQYNLLLKQKNKLLKVERERKLIEQQTQKELLFKENYQIFLTNINGIYQRYLPIAQQLQSLKDAYYIGRNITGVDFDNQIIELKKQLKPIKDEFNALINPMCLTCDHPLHSYSYPDLDKNTKHFVKINNIPNREKIDKIDKIDNICFVLHTNLNDYKVGNFSNWSGGYKWNVYCIKCKSVQMREHEVSF